MGTIDFQLRETHRLHDCDELSRGDAHCTEIAAANALEAFTRENERLTRELAAAIKLERVWRACWQSAEGDLKEIDRLLTESDSNIDVAHQIAIDAGKAYESAPDAALKGVKSDEQGS